MRAILIFFIFMAAAHATRDPVGLILPKLESLIHQSMHKKRFEEWR
jgi:hypothetical protein